MASYIASRRLRPERLGSTTGLLRDVLKTRGSVAAQQSQGKMLTTTGQTVVEQNLTSIPAYVETTVMGSKLTSAFGLNVKRDYLPANYAIDIISRNLTAQKEIENEWPAATIRETTSDEWVYLENNRVKTFTPKIDDYLYMLDTVIADPETYLLYLSLYRGAGMNLREKLPYQYVDLEDLKTGTPSGIVTYAPGGIGRFVPNINGKRVAIHKAQSGGLVDPNLSSDWASYYVAHAGAPVPVAGLDWTEITNIEQTGTPLPNVTRDRNSYSVRILNFYEVLFHKYLLDTFGIMDIAAGVTDEAALKNAFSTIVNRYTQQYRGLIDQSHDITIDVYDIRSAEPVVQTAIISGNYDALKSLPVLFSYKVKSSIPDNFIDGPIIYWPCNDSLPPLIHEGSGAIIFDGIELKEGDRLTCRQAIRAIIRKGLFMIELQLPKIGAAVALTQDKNASILPTEANVDPYRNPFLVYSGADKEGRAIFTDVSRSTADRSALPKVITGAAGVPLAKYFEQTPDLIQDYFRGYKLDEGGVISAYDLQRMGVGSKKSSLLPWLLGGLAAGYVALQVM